MDQRHARLLGERNRKRALARPGQPGHHDSASDGQRGVAHARQCPSPHHRRHHEYLNVTNMARTFSTNESPTG